jgi:hypothetical protein
MNFRQNFLKNNISRIVLLSALNLIFLSVTSCSSTFTRYDPLEETMHLVIFAVPEGKFPENNDIRKELPPVEAFPEITEDQMQSILRSFHFEKSALWGRSIRHTFYEEEITYITPFILDHLKKLPEKQRLVVVSRHDPDRSVLSRMDRITFTVWNDETGINFLFGEIREEIPMNDPFADDEWKSIYPIDPVKSYPDLRLVQADDKEPLFTNKEVLGRKHLTWAVINRDHIEILAEKFPAPVKPKELTKEEIRKNEMEDLQGKKSSEQKSAPKSLVDRLRELQEALDAKLITTEEYDSRKKAILDSH